MRINIAYSCNDSYIPQTGISMISLFENNKNIEKIHVYFIEKDVAQESITKLKKIALSYERNFSTIHFSDLCRKLKVSFTGRHIETIYSKLFFSGIDDDIDLILYIDSDTIITGSLEELFELNIEDYLLGEVQTFSASSRIALGMLKDDLFFNDGVALLNLKKMRELNIEDKFISFIQAHNGNPPVLSEGTINAVCKNQIYSLHPKYNLMSGLLFFSQKTMDKIYGRPYYSQPIISEAIKNPVIIHYLSAFYNRPWCKKCTHPYKDKYLFYSSISPWNNMPLSNKDLTIKLKLIKFIYTYFPSTWANLLRDIKKRITK